MKKILTAILVIAMIASLASVFSFADAAFDGTASDPGQRNPITITAGEVTVKAGETEAVVDVTVTGIDKDLGISAIIASFEAEGASIKSVVGGADLPGNNIVTAHFEKYDVAYWADSTGIKSESVVFAKVTVEIPADAKEGDVITIKVLVDQDPDMYLSVGEDANGNRIAYGAKAVAGSVKVVKNDSVKAGDVNGDGSINAKDVVAIMKSLVGKTPDKFDKAAADYNGDGSVNAKDVVKLMKDIIKAASAK